MSRITLTRPTLMMLVCLNIIIKYMYVEIPELLGVKVQVEKLWIR